MAKFDTRADICFDTNILIYLAGVENNNIKVINELKRDGIYTSIDYILDKIKKDKIRAIITPTVYKEIMSGVSKFGPSTINFIRENNFYLLEIPKEKTEILYKVNRLAKAYCQKLDNKQKDLIRKINSKPNCWYAYSVFGYKDKRKEKPINDAIIMAEVAVVLEVPIATNNTKDFTAEGRKDIIAYINKINHVKTSAIPYTSCEIVEYLKKQKVFQTVNTEWEGSIIETSIEQ